jgi:hypothetical protein
LPPLLLLLLLLPLLLFYNMLLRLLQTSTVLSWRLALFLSSSSRCGQPHKLPCPGGAMHCCLQL